jgi:O-antigen/teichoic acid export membrane protein
VGLRRVNKVVAQQPPLVVDRHLVDARPLHTVLHRLRSDVFVYGTTLAVPKLLAILTVPVYTRRLARAEYGALQVAMATALVLAPIFTLGMDASLSYFFFSKGRDGSVVRRDVVSSVLQIRVAWGLAVLLGALAFLWYSAGASGAAFRWYLLIAACGAFLEQLSSQAADVFRLLHRPFAYGVTTGLQAVGGAALGLLLAVGLGWGVTGAVLGTASAAALTGACAWFRLRALVGMTERQTLWWPRILKFGIPMVPAGLGVMLLHSLDRFLLATLMGADDVAVYGAGAEFAGVVSLIVASFRVAWWPIAMAEVNEGRTAVFPHVARLYVGLAAILGVVSAFAFPLATAWLLPPRYARSAGVAATIPWRWLCYGFFMITSAGIWKSERTGWSVVPIALALVVNAIAGVLLIPVWGIQGAAWAAVAGSLTWVVSAMAISERLYHIGYPYSTLIAQTTIGLGASALLLWWSGTAGGAFSAARLGFTVVASLVLLGTIRHSVAILLRASRVSGPSPSE